MPREVISSASTSLSADGPAAGAAALRVLRGGGLVALPTETVYGLAADAGNPAAVARLYAAKGRPRFNPLIAHVADREAAQGFGQFNVVACALAQRFWPGPLTLVVPSRGIAVCDLARAGLDSVALRVPAHPVMRDVLRGFGGPLVAPSANRSGHVSSTTPAHVAADFGVSIDLILDAGPAALGVESTIVSCLADEPVLLRPGALPVERLNEVLGFSLRTQEPDAKPVAPGQLSAHYATRAKLRLDAGSVQPGEALLAFGDPLPSDGPVLNLSAAGDLTEAAANFFAHLRALDALEPAAIAVMPLPREGLGAALHDRLRRAALGR